ncbi:MAG: winged helix-turn-helix transcriptional regulator [Ruminococcaceae bacterium]|nr:winged helix-turn-helix transcriptional regulator [Oscillospiraceae bacterium]
MEHNEFVCNCEIIHTEVLEHALKEMPDENEIYDLSDFFKMFGDSTRIKIMCALDRGEMCVCDLANLLNMTKSAISHQLKSLKQCDLVKSRREGKSIIYSLSDDHVKQIVEMGLDHIRE